jgi:hypothetical protein
MPEHFDAIVVATGGRLTVNRPSVLCGPSLVPLPLGPLIPGSMQSS